MFDEVEQDSKKMKLKIEICGLGAEFAVNEIPRKAYKYIKDKFNGDIDEYANAMDAGEVPDEYQMLEGTAGSFYEDGDYYQSLGPFPDSSFITVENEDTGEKYIDGGDVAKFIDEQPIDLYNPKEDAKRGQHFVMAQSLRKGFWGGWHIETDDKEFDEKKLKLTYDTLCFNSKTYKIVTGLEYDDEDYDLGVDGCTDEKSAWLEIDSVVVPRRHENHPAEEEKAAPPEETPAKKKSANKNARAVDPAVVEGIIASMVPIPGKDFRMGKFPVTQAQYTAVMDINPSEFEGTENPVETVSWDDCQAFLETLNAQPAAKASGLTFRLPELDEWEYACRAGSTGKYCKLADGTEITEESLGEVAWFDDHSDDGTHHPVGQKKPNAFGLYDMLGNVQEWTATADGGARVYRGGSWFDSAEDCESSGRDSPSARDNSLGFRLCASGRAD